MPDPYTVVDAEEVQKNLRERLGHAQVHVKPYGRNLLIQMEDSESVVYRARLFRPEISIMPPAWFPKLGGPRQV